MRIAIDVSQMCYTGTGVARYVYGLTEALLNAESPHQIVLYAGTLRQKLFFTDLSKKHPWDKADWKIFPLPPKLSGYAFNQVPIPFELLVGKVDLVHSSDWSQPSSKAKLVTTVHDLVFKKYPETVDPLILNTQIRRMKKIIASKTHIIADSTSTKNDLMEIYGLSASAIDVVYPGISGQYSPSSNTEIERVKKKYNLPSKYLLSLGTQEPRKNVARLIEAVKGLGIPLVIAGKYGWDTATSSAQKLPQSDEVMVLGYVSDADIPGLYSGATAFIYPSLYEGFGFPVLEAMACGAPVVTSNLSSLPEIAGGAAILINPLDVDAIKAGIITAIESSDTLRERGISQAKKFTWASSASKVISIYEKIGSS